MTWTVLLAAGAVLAGCERAAEPPPAAPAPRLPADGAPSAALPAAEPAPAIPPTGGPIPPALPAPAWPKGLALRRSGVLGGATAPAAWYELAAENTSAVDAARRTLAALTAAAGDGALSDLAAGPDGKTAIGQVRGPRLSAVVAASDEGRGTLVRVTLEPLAVPQPR